MTVPATFGPIVQNAYVVRDLEAAAHHWAQGRHRSVLHA
jgi:hypothetical protein